MWEVWEDVMCEPQKTSRFGDGGRSANKCTNTSSARSQWENKIEIRKTLRTFIAPIVAGKRLVLQSFLGPAGFAVLFVGVLCGRNFTVCKWLEEFTIGNALNGKVFIFLLKFCRGRERERGGGWLEGVRKAFQRLMPETDRCEARASGMFVTCDPAGRDTRKQLPVTVDTVIYGPCRPCGGPVAQALRSPTLS
ncbi:hypothetical protein BaRGS_00018314 [Batillaria attramentaria]|uniref:Uncharacterized protein n=1 Tax=Batillaria attramentaria TaxID=370345 RepID=A0ABD0KU29_9CAEN